MRTKNDKENIFTGWKDYYAEGTGTDILYTGKETMMVTKRTDLFAQWVGSLHIVYHAGEADGGELPVDPNRYQENETVTIQWGSLTRKGYQFIGWSRTEGSTTPEFTKGNLQHTLNSTDLQLYPVWQPEEYSVQFYDAGGRLLTGEDYTFTGMHYGDVITVPGLDVTDLQVIGWSLTKDGEIACRVGEKLTVTEDTALYVCVAAERVCVTYKSGNGQTEYGKEYFGKGIPGYLTLVPTVGGTPGSR